MRRILYLISAVITGAGGVVATGNEAQSTVHSIVRPAGKAEQGVTCAMLPAGIRTQESGGRYRAYGVPVRSHGGARALGAYQVMPANLPGWSKDVVGRQVSQAEFMGSPALQDRIAGTKLSQLCRRYGPRGAAAAWFSGRPELANDTKPRGGGAKSVKAYVDSVIRHARNHGKD